MTHPHTPFVTKRASFAIKESLFFIKVGKVTFFCEKSLSCRYSALSLHLETVGKWQISDSFSRSASTLPSLCLRSGFALPSLWVRFRRRRKAQGNASAETRLKQEYFDRFASLVYIHHFEPKSVIRAYRMRRYYFFVRILSMLKTFTSVGHISFINTPRGIPLLEV